MKKIIAFFLILLGLTFVACGKESGIGEFIDKEKISSEYNIEKEDENSIEFTDKNEDSDKNVDTGHQDKLQNKVILREFFLLYTLLHNLSYVFQF